MRAYLAAPYAAREQIRSRARDLVTIGVDVTSSWLLEDTEINAGTVGAAPAVDPMSADAHVEMAIDDVKRSDVLVLFTESAVDVDPELCRSGGRHVETGIALAVDKPILVVGEVENIFHRSRRVERVPDWLSAIAWFIATGGRMQTLSASQLCPECSQGKPGNCTGWVISTDDQIEACATAEVA